MKIIVNSISIRVGTVGKDRTHISQGREFDFRYRCENLIGT